MNAGKWLAGTCATVVLLCLAVAAANYVVDPWDVNQFYVSRGFNEYKPNPLAIVRLNKAYGVARLKPAGVAMGTSTAELGLDVGHPAWNGFEPAYNLSFPGATIGEILAILQAAHSVSPVRRAVIGLDFFSFNAHREMNAQTLQAVEIMRSPLARIRTYFTRSMLVASFNTVVHQHRYGPYFRPDGRSDTEAFVQWIGRMKGHYNLFAYAVQQTVRGLLALPLRRFEFQRGQEQSTLDQFRELLEFARRSGIELRLFFSPYHAWQYETIRAIGLWPSFEYWKQQLAFIADGYARRKDAGPAVALWDFADYSEFTTEGVPEPGDAGARMRWTWDGQHYTRELGDLIQNRMSGRGVPLPEDFGIRLDARNVNAHLLNVRAHQQQYRQSHAHEVAEVEKIVAETLKSFKNR